MTQSVALLEGGSGLTCSSTRLINQEGVDSAMNLVILD